MASGSLRGAFPTLETELWNAHIHIDYDLSARCALRGRLEYEAYDSSDWALDGIAAVLAFGQLPLLAEAVYLPVQRACAASQAGTLLRTIRSIGMSPNRPSAGKS